MKELTIRQPWSARAVFAVALFTSALAILAAFGILGGNASAASSGEYQYGNGKVTICHHTGSMNHPTQTITVSESALRAHLAHGDTLGPCPDGS